MDQQAMIPTDDALREALFACAAYVGGVPYAIGDVEIGVLIERELAWRKAARKVIEQIRQWREHPSDSEGAVNVLDAIEEYLKWHLPESAEEIARGK